MKENSKRILIATPMMPPTAGGPATHAKKLYEHFALSPLSCGEGSGGRVMLFNFEKYKRYPSGIRHLLTFMEFVSPFNKRETGGFWNKDIIFALDGFTVALPAVFAGMLLRKKVILRIGGDFIYEEFLNIQEVTFEEFYNNFGKYKELMKQKNYKLYLKYLVQKFVLQNCYGIIFNTEWQKNIYIKHYSLPGTSPSLKGRVGEGIYVIQNPVEPIDPKIYDNEIYENNSKYIFTSITRDIPYKNLTRLKQAFQELESPSSSLLGREVGREGYGIYLETTQGTWPSCLKRISMSRAYICASISDISPNQVQEALSLKIPVIISKYTGITKILQEAGVARVIDPFDLEDIKNAVQEMCDDKIWSEYKKNLENFTWPQNWDTLFKQYEKIITEII